MARPVIWIAGRLSDATLARADRDYDIIFNHDDIPYNSDEIIAICQLLLRAALPLPTHLTYCPMPRLKFRFC